MRKFAFTFIAALLLFIAGTGFAKAASLYFSPNAKQVSVGDILSVRVLINTDGKPINNSQAAVSFPADLLEVVSLSKSGSIFSLWVEEPAFSNQNGEVTFNGGLPTPGYTGSGGNALTIVFRAKAEGSASIFFASGSVLANDGLGTELLQSKGQAQFVLVKAETAAKAEAKQENQDADKNLATGSKEVEVFSASHPDSAKWYNLTKAVFSWKLPPGAAASQTSLDKTEKTTPRILRRPAVNTISAEGIKDGIWYFNSRFLTGGSWSKITAYKVQVDTAAPEKIIITPAGAPGGSRYPTVSASDELSGIDYFIIQADGAAGVKIVPSENVAEIKIPGISAGMHHITAYAYDLAGNSASAQADLEFKRESGLNIVSYTKEVIEAGRIEAEGLGPANSLINIQLVTEEGITRTYGVSTDGNGMFNFRSEPLAATGNYKMWAEIPAVDGNAKVESARLNITVQKSVGSKIIQGFKYAAGLFSPTNIIILTLSFLCLLGWLNYFMLRKSIHPALQRKNAKSAAKKLE